MKVKKVRILSYYGDGLKNNEYNVENFEDITTLSLEEAQSIVFQTYDIYVQSTNDAIIDQNNTIIQLLCHIADNLNNK